MTRAAPAGGWSAGNEQDYDEVIKVVVVGDKSVGHTALIAAFTRADLDGSEPGFSTIGVDFRTRVLEASAGRRVKLRVWDVQVQEWACPFGTEERRRLMASKYKGASAALLVFDVADAHTFDPNIRHWLAEVRRGCPPEAALMLVGNTGKASPGEAQREISTDAASAFAEAENLPYAEVSATRADREALDRIFAGLMEQALDGRRREDKCGAASSARLRPARCLLQ